MTTEGDEIDEYLARTSKDHGFEVCVQHLVMTGCLDAAFAGRLAGYLYDQDQADMGLDTGLLHDIGKYSDEFQRMIREAYDEQ